MGVSQQEKGKKPRKALPPARWVSGGLVPAGLGMMGVPGGPPPPGGPCGETKRGSAAQTRASPTSPRFQTPSPSCTSHPQTQPGLPPTPGHRFPPQICMSTPSRNISAPRRQDGQGGAGGLTTYVPGDEEEYGIYREKRDGFSRGVHSREPPPPPSSVGMGVPGPTGPHSCAPLQGEQGLGYRGSREAGVPPASLARFS